FVYRAVNGEESPANEIEKQTGGGDSDQQLQGPNRIDEPGSFAQWPPGNLAQATRADDAALVLSDAFPTIIMPAFRAAGRRLAQGVIEATLMNQAGHYAKEPLSPEVGAVLAAWVA